MKILMGKQDPSSQAGKDQVLSCLLRACWALMLGLDTVNVNQEPGDHGSLKQKNQNWFFPLGSQSWMMLSKKNCPVIHFLCMFLLPKQFLLWRRCVVFCSFRAENLWATIQPHVHGPPAAAWGQQGGGEWGTSLAPCIWELQRRAAGSFPRLCRQGWHNSFCLPSFLGPAPPKLSPFLLLNRIDGDGSCLPAPSSCPKCRPSLLLVLVSQILCSPLS